MNYANGCKIDDSLFQHVLGKQKSSLAQTLSCPPQHAFCIFEIQRMRMGMFPLSPQVLDFKNMLN